MTKHDILKMKTTAEVMKTLATHRDLWDEEVNEHLKQLAQKKLVDKFGDSDVAYTPPMKKQ